MIEPMKNQELSDLIHFLMTDYDESYAQELERSGDSSQQAEYRFFKKWVIINLGAALYKSRQHTHALNAITEDIDAH